MIKILSAEHVCSAPSPKFFPEEILPGFSFIGRSNVGKSSLINALVNRRGLARTSKQPGRTQLINFFKLILKENDEKRECYLVDFPGYGYAQVAKSQRATWSKMIESYFDKYEMQATNFLLHDVRRELGKEEHWVVENIKNLSVIVTKADKVGLKEINRCKKDYKNIGIQELFLTSSSKKRGIDELLKTVYDKVGTL